MKDFKVAAYQMGIVTGEKKRNLQKVEQRIQSLEGKGVDLLVLPELFTTGFDYAQFPLLAELEGESETLDHLEALAKEYELGLAGSLLTTDDQKEQYYNLGFVVSPSEGIIYKYHKIHLWGREKEHFTAGKQIPKPSSFEGKVNIALAICYDLRFPEVYRAFALSGAELLLTIAAWPEQRWQHFHLLAKARALENTSFHVAVNRFGEEQTDFLVNYNGKSGVFSPLGEVLAEAGEGEGLIISALPAKALLRARKTIPVLKDCTIKLQ